MSSPYRELKERAWAANQEIPKRGLAIYTFGNVSALDAARGVIAIKPSGVEYERLTVDDLVVVDLSGKIVEGKLRPSSDTQDPPRPLPGLEGHRQRRPHALELRDRMGPGAAPHPHLRDHPRRPLGRGCALHRRHVRRGGGAGLRGRDRKPDPRSAFESRDPLHTSDGAGGRPRRVHLG